MSRTGTRIAIVVAALALAVVAFVVLRPNDETPSRAADNGSSTPPVASTARTEPAPASAEEERSERPEATEQPVRITARDGAPVGGVREIRATKGERVEIVVASDQPDELHLHGYDIERPVGPDAPGRLGFEADAEGIYELELHGSGQQLASVRVEP